MTLQESHDSTLQDPQNFQSIALQNCKQHLKMVGQVYNFFVNV